MSHIVNYPKGDLRRMLTVLAAIDSMPDATSVKVAAKTGLDKKTVTHLIVQAREQAGVNITKNGPVYALEDWGPVIKQEGAKTVSTAALKLLPAAPSTPISHKPGYP